MIFFQSNWFNYLGIKVALDSKVQYPAACNAIETLLIHKDIAKEFLSKAIPIFDSQKIELRGDSKSISFGVKLSAESQDLKYNGEYTQTIIGDNTTIREYVTIHKGTLDKKVTKIGSNCLLMSYVHGIA